MTNNLRGIIIFEGADGTGKTTLANWLVRNCGAVYMHMTHRFMDKMFLYHTAALHRAVELSKTRLVVIDRLWLSEEIYARTFRNNTAWPQHGRMFERVFQRFGVLTVLCLGGEQHAARFQALRKDRKEMFNSMQEVNRRYEDLCFGAEISKPINYCEQQTNNGGLWPSRNVLSFKMEKEPSIYLFLTGALEQLNLLQGQISFPTDQQNLVGNVIDPKILFVGDKTNGRYARLAWPFHAEGGGSRYLVEQLAQINFDEQQACWINIHGPLGKELISKILTKGPRVVVFGQAAAKTYRKLFNRSFVALPHPQFANRFHHLDDYFLKSLKEALCLS